MPTSYRGIPPLQAALLVPLAPFKVDGEESPIPRSPELSHGLGLACTHTQLQSREHRGREGRVELLVARIIRNGPQVP